MRWLFLVCASFFFYGWWDYRFLSLLLVSGLIDFFAALGMDRYPRARRSFLAFSLVGNLGILFSFKYYGFFMENMESIADLFGMSLDGTVHTPEFMLILPLGISFYTFQSMSYTIDVYNGQLKPTRSVLHFFAYLSLFPQLVAGPIIRARDMLPQLLTARPITREARWEGMVLVVHGYFKKVVIADNLAMFVATAFADPVVSGSGIYWWLIALAFTIQIYCDFSGYSDIARGLAKWMGYDMQINFNHPYIATSIQEFWDRWHISLTSWFRDYIFHGMVRKKIDQLRETGGQLGQQRMIVYLWITMLLSGLWHGAAWHFILWGALHGLYLHIEIVTRWPMRMKKLFLGRWIAWLLTFFQVIVAMTIFRAQSLSQLGEILFRMLTFHNGLSLGLGEFLSIRDFGVISLLIGTVLLRELYMFTGLDRKMGSSAMGGFLGGPMVVALMAIIAIYLRGSGAEFIYFQF
ncbi:MAG: MBOAT family protein [Magnetococcales bacterium]|nr:MBOAT family protein [Magnetococcales bacterium]